jgi:hypothetical protein
LVFVTIIYQDDVCRYTCGEIASIDRDVEIRNNLKNTCVTYEYYFKRFFAKMACFLKTNVMFQLLRILAVF